MEARERMLQDMEAKARERAEAAEAEGYRLKGLLMHMETMVEQARYVTLPLPPAASPGRWW